MYFQISFVHSRMQPTLLVLLLPKGIFDCLTLCHA
jgi:hypothetical protein